MFVKPADGRMPRDPRTMLRIPKEGIEVSEHDPSFAALRFHGDLIEGERPAPAPEAKKPAAQLIETANAEEH